jgi:hypothetical protein
LEDRRFRDDDGNQVGLERVAVEVDLADQRTDRVGPLDLLQSHVFALGQLDQVLDPIDDLKSTLLINQPNVSGVLPSFRIDQLLGLRLILVLDLKDKSSLQYFVLLSPAVHAFYSRKQECRLLLARRSRLEGKVYRSRNTEIMKNQFLIH